MSSIGRYHGTNYRKARLCDMFPHLPNVTEWWFVLADGEPTGDHFRTLAELEQYIDSGEMLN